MANPPLTPSDGAHPGSACQAPAFLAGGGELGERMRQMDWSATALGPVDHWPQSLKTAVRIMLTSSQAIWIGWGPDLIYLYNDPYRAIIGGKHPKGLGQPTRAVWSEIWDVISPMLSKAMTGDEGTYVESQLLIMERHGYREETYYTFSYSPIPNDDGSPGGIICANTDDTRRVVGERQLALLRDLAAGTAYAHTWQDACAGARKALASNSHDLPFSLIFVAEREGSGLTLAGTSGLSGDALEGLLVKPESWPLDTALTQREIQVVAIPPRLLGLHPPTGAWIEAPSRAALIPLAAHGVAGRAGVLVVGLNPYRLFDESYRNFLELVGGQVAAGIASARAYEEERRRAEELAELDRAKTEFFSNVSHEFRTPLTLMLGPIEDMLEKSYTDLTPASKNQLEIVHRNSLRLLKLVNTMLDFSRIEAGRVEATFGPVDLAAYTAELASVFRAAVERAGLKLVVDCPPLPEPVFIDRDMWEKIVLNLLSNAFKFTLAGEIGVKLEAAAGEMRLTVSDTGVGIPAEELPRLFERFHRVRESRGRTHEGTGIGLALVQELVHLHGGSIRVASTLDRGSQFVVSVPRGRAHLDERRIRALPERAAGSLAATTYVQEALRWTPGGESGLEEIWLGAARAALPAARPESRPGRARPRILWADDNRDMRDYVGRLLAERFEVTAVGDGEAALLAARVNPPEVILSDVMMPKLDGFGLIRALRADPALSTIPVILLSARAGEEARVEGVEAGADDYLIKPFSARELVARVDAHVKMARFRRQADAALRDSEARFRAIFETTPECVKVVAADGMLLHMNTAGAGMIGASGADALVGKSIYDVIAPEDRGRFKEFNERVCAGTGGHLEFDLVGLDGGRRHMETRASPLRNPDGQVVQLAITRDVTLRRQAEERRQADDENRIRVERQLKEARDDALAANRAKDEFLATLSHELRTPLNPVLLVASESATDPALAPAVRADFKMISDNISLQARLIDDLLDFNRIVHGKVTLEQRPLDLHQVIREAAKTIQEEIAAKEIRLVTALRAPATTVHGDPVRLRQVFWNVLKNAVKFSPQGGRIDLTSSLVDADGKIEIRIQDWGVGIRADELERIFYPFIQGRHAGEGERQTFGGLGLGLAIARMLVEAQGGSIAAESKGLGSGATVVVRLPVRAAHPVSVDGAPEGDNQNAPIRGPGSDGRGQRILFVEDHDPTRQALTHLLTRRGYAVAAARSVADALQQAERAPFEILISDLGLPDGDGCELMTTLRRTRPDLLGIAISGYGMDADLARSRAAGFGEHLTKPVSIDFLERALTRLSHTEISQPT